MASGVVTASRSDEERTLIDTPSRSGKHEEGECGSLGVSWSEEASMSAEVPAPATFAQSASSYEADSSDSTPGSPTRALTPVVDEPKRWCVNWVTKTKGSIKKTNMTFTSIFLWLIVCHYLSLMAPYNIVTWDRSVLMVAMIVGFEMDFAWLLKVVMHNRAFIVQTSYPFPCMIFSLCRSTGVPF